MASIVTITAAQLADGIGDAEELALVDTREAGIFGEGHAFLAVNAPFSRLEAVLPALVPRLDTRLVLIAEPGLEARVFDVAAGFGYGRAAVLADGVAGWEALGHALFKGVNVPSKAFAELVEHAFHTPAVEPAEFEALKAAGRRVVLLDPRTRAEFDAFHVPGALHAPGAEIVLRVGDLAPDPDAVIVVSCAGRTRGIIGAQALIDAGETRPVYALSGGTQGWRLAGYDLARDGRAADYAASPQTLAAAAERVETLARRFSIPRITRQELAAFRAEAGRTTYVFDVRQPEERGPSPEPGFIFAEGGQLVQALDTWVGTLKARLVLADSAPGLRALITAHWLKQQGWEVHVLPDLPDAVAARPGPQPATAPAAGHAGLSPDDLAEWLRAGAAVIFAGDSGAYLQAHPEGAIWANRSRPEAARQALAQAGRAVVLGLPPERELLAADLAATGAGPVAVFAGDWRAAGLAGAAGGLTDEQRIDHLFWVHDRHQGNNAASRAYLDWELGLPEAVERAGPVLFRLSTPALTARG